jgi:hypothetical protein
MGFRNLDEEDRFRRAVQARDATWLAACARYWRRKAEEARRATADALDRRRRNARSLDRLRVWVCRWWGGSSDERGSPTRKVLRRELLLALRGREPPEGLDSLDEVLAGRLDLALSEWLDAGLLPPKLARALVRLRSLERVVFRPPAGGRKRQRSTSERASRPRAKGGPR